MPDNSYGDLIYYINYPLIFDLEGLTLMGEKAIRLRQLYAWLPPRPPRS